MTDLQVGISVRDITPAFPVWLHGYGARTRRSSGTAEPIELACLAVQDSQQTVLLITCDMIGIKQHVCERLYERIEARSGVAFPNTLISCSHTHFAPGLHATTFASPELGIVEPDERYVEAFETRLLEAVDEALAQLRPATLQAARVSVPNVVFNRRTITSDNRVTTNYLYPEDPTPYTFRAIDPELTVLRFVGSMGPIAALMNFGCHPVTGTETVPDGHYCVSADYPWYARRTLADAYHCPVAFCLGAAGDAVPINRQGNCRERIGSILGNSAVLAERTFVSEESPDLWTHCEKVPAKVIMPVTSADPESACHEAREACLALSAEGVSGEKRRAATEAFQRTATEWMRARLYPENAFDIPVQCVGIGGTTLVALPFEVLSEISLKLKDEIPGSVLVSCAGGYQGYLPLRYEYERGGYEASAESTHFEPGTADRLLDTMIDTLKHRRNAPGPAAPSALPA